MKCFVRVTLYKILNELYIWHFLSFLVVMLFIVNTRLEKLTKIFLFEHNQASESLYHLVQNTL